MNTQSLQASETKRWATIALLTLCAIAYLPAWLSFFVKDDIALATSARIGLDTLLSHSWPGGFFRPAAELLFAVQHTLFGLSPLPYHLVSFSAHLATTFFVYRLFDQLPPHRPYAFIAAALFALHPLNTETVSWISGQMSLFSTLCTLAMLYWLRISRPLIALVPFFILGLGFYENFLLVLLLWGMLCLCDDQFRATLRPAPLYALGICSAGYLYWRFWVLNLSGGNYQPALSLKTGLLNIVYYFYLLVGGSAIGGRVIRYRPDQLYDYFFDVFTPLLICNTLLVLAYLWLAHRNAIRPTTHAALPLAWIAIALLPALLLPERPRRLSYLAVPGYALALSHILFYLYTKTRLGLARTGIAFYALLLVATLYLRNDDWQSAGGLERAIPTVVAAHCHNLVFDVPNLLGDALFFNSISTSLWLGSQTARPVSIRAHQEQNQLQPAQDCSYRFIRGTGTIRLTPDAVGSPLFTRGHNWVRTR